MCGETLTVELLVLPCEGGLQRAAVVSQQSLQLLGALHGQVLLHVAGAAGVTLSTDAKVLPYQQDRRRQRKEEEIE